MTRSVYGTLCLNAHDNMKHKKNTDEAPYTASMIMMRREILIRGNKVKCSLIYILHPLISFSGL